MEKDGDRSAYAAEKNSRRRRKRARVYTFLACRRDDPSDLYGVMFYTSRKNGGANVKLIAVKNRCVFRIAFSRADSGDPESPQTKWNEMANVLRLVAARGKVRKRVRYVSSPPFLPKMKGSCYEAVKTSVSRPHDKIYVGRRTESGKIRVKRMPLEDFRFFVSRVWSKSCPVEFSPEGERALRALAEGRRMSVDSNRLGLDFSVKKGFDFIWGGSRNASACPARRDHEPGPVESGTRAGDHKPVNPVARAVNVIRSPGVQNPGTDEMRKGESPNRSGSEGGTRAPDRNSESAALSTAPVSGKRAGSAPPFDMQ